MTVTTVKEFRAAIIKGSASLICASVLVACAAQPDIHESTIPRMVHKFGSSEPGLIKSHLGNRSREVRSSGHIGVNFAVEVRTPVYAVAEGRVQSPGPVGAKSTRSLRVFSDRLRPAGMIVYHGINKIQFTTGEAIQAGQLIGYVDRPDQANEPMLHVALINTTTLEAFDPEPYFLNEFGSVQCIDFQRVGVPAHKGGYNSDRFRLALERQIEGSPLLFPFDCENASS